MGLCPGLLMMNYGVCPKCLAPWDLHCFKCEAVVLCPYPTRDGTLTTPCGDIGPKSKDSPRKKELSG